MRDSMKDITDVYREALCYHEQGSGFVNKPINGPPLITNKKWKSRSLEVRINLQKKFFRVASLPDYESVVELNKPDGINLSESYRFMLRGLDRNSKMTIVKLDKV